MRRAHFRMSFCCFVWIGRDDANDIRCIYMHRPNRLWPAERIDNRNCTSIAMHSIDQSTWKGRVCLPTIFRFALAFQKCRQWLWQQDWLRSFTGSRIYCTHSVATGSGFTSSIGCLFEPCICFSVCESQLIIISIFFPVTSCAEPRRYQAHRNTSIGHRTWSVRTDSQCISVGRIWIRCLSRKKLYERVGLEPITNHRWAKSEAWRHDILEECIAFLVVGKCQWIFVSGSVVQHFIHFSFSLQSSVAAFQPQPSTSQGLTSVNVAPMKNPIAQKSSTPELQEDEVDVALAKIDGRLQRNRDPKLCRHNSNGCCVHCSPLEPWNEEYLKEQKIKHLSFHAYIRKLTSGVDRGKFVALEDAVCRIKTGCREHPPWPKGICSKCQPSAITLNRQTYRHVDNVMFENAALVERFLNYWRTTGHQRLGYLYGRYEVNNDVPLGIRAQVAAIYEPPQESTRNSIKLLDDERGKEVDDLANKLGLRKVGWIFTDLISEDGGLGTVKHLRGIDTHFLTAQECILAGHLQNQHPNVCKYSSNGYFGSKFVTVCVTGESSVPGIIHSTRWRHKYR